MIIDLLDATILIIDDDTTLTGLLERMFVQIGCQVDIAYTWDGVQLLLERHAGQNVTAPYDLIILDLHLPGISGTEIFQELRQHMVTHDTPVIILSAAAGVEQRILLLDSGVDDYIAKPFSVNELLTRATVHIRLSQMRRARQAAEAQVELQARHLRAINLIAARATEYIDLDQMLQQVVTAVCEHFEVCQMAVYLVDTDSGMWQETAVSEADIPNYVHLIHAVSTHRLTSQNGRQVAIPLIRRDNMLLGLIAFQVTADNNSQASTIQALETLAPQIVSGITNCYLFQDIQQHNQKLQSIAANNSRLYQELQLSQAQLVQSEKLAAMGRLAASLAHEINNPLQAVHSCLQLGLNFKLDAQKQNQYLNMANEEVERMIDLVSRILEFTRPSAKIAQPISLHQVIKQVMQLAQKYTAHQDVTIQEVRASDLPPVMAVEDQLAHVFLNIMLNAFDAMPSSGTLIIQTQAVDQWVMISFQDNGIGMEEDIQRRIFEPFFTTKLGATGLGLTISYGIIERHGGQIKVESQPNQGTIITLSLPRAAGNR